MGMKLVDAALMLEGNIILCDTDILFVRPFHSAFVFPSEDVDVIHLKDYADSYCWKPWQTMRYSLPHRFNAGMMMIRRRFFELEGMERLVRTIETSYGYSANRSYQWFVEQTCWAALAGKLRTYRWKPKQMRVISKHDRYNQDFVAGHFVGSVRHLLAAYRDEAQRWGYGDGSPSVQIELERAEPYSISNFAINRLQNRLSSASAKLFT
ncbi:putative nucleotide-diphospho-sugar transferase [Microvirga terrae]|uniref:Nucleotide-diphospho-sugar transferase n=1 Tax=Microvirga terrae TaxID=2740529 RepID=A0ABY5RMI1_9HYPH|nr:putative nucleotide-diphospho-sugar transferase [Microvirga terrae]UVF18405.1 putative nucleotide-diphospho-sugar transferase [Microvirga terrae]